MGKFMKLSFVIPCYRSENTIRTVVEEIRSTVAKRKEYSYEIILVNDNSPDNVWHVIRELATGDEIVKGISLARNFGQHAALMAGYACTDGDIVISLDDDGQSPADELFKLVDKLQEGYDVVYGAYLEVRQNKFRIFGSWVNEKMNEILLGKPKGLKGTSYYAAKRFIIDEMLRYRNAYPYVGGLVFRSTRNIANVTINQRNRLEGTSGYSFFKLFSLWMNGFTAFSEKPLRMASFLGVFCAFTGFIYGIVIIIRKICNPAVPIGYSSTMAVLLLIGGVLMLLLGIIGEYIGRIYISINNAPQYVIRETTENKDDLNWAKNEK